MLSIILALMLATTLSMASATNSVMPAIISYLLSDSTPPTINKPTNLTSAPSEKLTCVELSWKDKSYNETLFNIERKSGSTWNKISTLSKNSGSYRDCSNIVHASNYCYRVQAKNDTLGSEYSNESCATASFWWKNLSARIVTSAVTEINGIYQSGSQFSFQLVNQSNLSDLKITRLIVKNGYGTTVLSQPMNTVLIPQQNTGHTLTLSSNQKAPLTISYVIENQVSEVQQNISTITKSVYPISDAGADQVIKVGSVVQLDGSNSNTSSGSLSYLWSLSKTSGNPTSGNENFSDVNSLKPTFTADSLGIYTAYLMVSNGTYSSIADSVNIYVTLDGTFNTPPVAHAGYDQTIRGVKVVTLDGTRSSDVDGDDLNYQWSIVSKPEGSIASLSSTTASNPTFVPEIDGTYRFSLKVNDGSLESENSDEVQITYSNRAPTAYAGSDKTVRGVKSVSLSGTSSYDYDGDTLNYYWQCLSKPDGSTCNFSDDTISQTTFTPVVNGTYLIRLEVTDGRLSSGDELTITYSNANPVADTGAGMSAETATLVTLDASGSSDTDGDTLSYIWNILSKPQGSSVSLNATDTINPNFTPDISGNYLVELNVTDGLLNSSDQITITTTYKPIADSGDDIESARYSKIYLSGYKSTDQDGDNLSYYWSLIKPSGSASTLSSTNEMNTTFIADREGEYRASLIVHDGVLDSAPSTVNISVTTQYFKIDGHEMVPTYEETIPQPPQVPLAP